MQAADDVQFRDADFQGFARFFDDFFDGKLETIGVAFFTGKGAELAGENAVIGIIDVAVDDVAGAIADFALAHEIRDGADGI